MGEILRLVVAYRQMPKRGLSPEQCEDAWAANLSAGRFAVADGATDSYASGRFARLLVDGFVGESGPRSAAEIAPWARETAEAWAEATPTEGLPWYKQEKARLGAHCTFLGVQLEASSFADGSTDNGAGEPAAEAPGQQSGAGPAVVSSLAYRAFAVGDVCLFQVRGNCLVEAMPVTRPEDFGVQPALIATSHSYPGPGVDELVEWTGEISPGDQIYLASDALAHWFLASEGEGEQPWHALSEYSGEEFGALVERLRDEGKMRNDDVTLVAIGVEAPGESPLDVPSTPPEEIAERLPVENLAGEDLTGERQESEEEVSVEAPRRHLSSARRQIERAAVISLAVGALGVGIAIVCGPRAASSVARSLGAGR